MEVHVSFRGRKPVPQHVDIGTERENKVTVLCFEGLPKMDGSTAYLHIDLGDNSDVIEIVDGQADVTRTITQFTGSVEAFVEVLGANDRVWHSQIMELFVGRLPILGEKIAQEYPTAFEQALAQTAADKAAAAKSAADAAATAAGIVTEEKNRQDAERKRVAAETARGQAEGTRVENERLRASAESERVKAEAAREKAEANREKAEAAREQETAAAVKRADDLVKNVETKLENGDFIGAQGPQGPIGETGPQGVPGAQGEKGEKGDKGDTGATGPQGAPGADGADGAPGKDGRDGLDAPQIDDTTVSSSAPWSSQHIVDMLCPPLKESGNPVVCYPVAGSTLGVKVSWEPTQEGTGTPSPDNIRPIKGRTQVKVERCGENLANTQGLNYVGWATTYQELIDELNKLPIGVYALRCMMTLDSFSDRFTSNTATASALMLRVYAKNGKGIIIIPPTQVTKQTLLPLTKALTAVFSITEENVGKIERCYCYSCGRDTAVEGAPNGQLGTGRIYDVCIVSSSTAPATYTPYTGSTTMLTLPDTIYGGEVDAVTGTGKKTWAIDTKSASDWRESSDCTEFVCAAPYTNMNNDRAYSNVFDVLYLRHNGSCYRISKGNTGFATIDDLHKAIGAAPVQIAYKLATPVLFQATGGDTIPTVKGTSTILTDADALTVTGRADPIHIIQQLQAASSASAQALADVERAVTDI